MKDSIKIRQLNSTKAEYERLVSFLFTINDIFDTPLDNRVNINEYAKKLLTHGVSLVAEDKGTIVGILAGYANDVNTKKSYISVFGIAEEYRSLGIDSRLLKIMKSFVFKQGMDSIGLYTPLTNKGAIKFYKKHGFVEKNDNQNRKNDTYLECLLKIDRDIFTDNEGDVLVTAIGSFSADIVIKTIKELGFNVIGCDIYQKEWIADATNVDHFYQAPFVNEEKKYLQFIDSICKKHNIKYIFPLTDPEVDLLSMEKERLKTQGVTVCTSSEDTIKLARNKLSLPEYLVNNVGVDVIPTKLLKDVNQTKGKMFIKPILGRSSQGAQVVHNEKDFTHLKNTLDNSQYIIQPFFEGNVITVDVVRDPVTNTVVSIPRRELLRNKSGAGTTVEVFENQELQNICADIVRKLDIIGAINIEFFETADRKYHFIEINPRFSGGVEFSHLAGYNVVKNHFRAFFDEPIDTQTELQPLIIARKYEEYITSYL